MKFGLATVGLFAVVAAAFWLGNLMVPEAKIVKSASKADLPWRPTAEVTPARPKGATFGSKVIAAGRGTESVYIGATPEDLKKALGEPNESYDYHGFCSHSDMHWLPKPEPDGTIEGDGIFAFIKDHHVFALRFGKGYTDTDGVQQGEDAQNLKQRDSFRMFILHPSANKSTNYRDLTFLVDRERGIAYELGSGPESDQKTVNAIYVFSPNGDFAPWGCVAENQKFTEIIDREY